MANRFNLPRQTALDANGAPIAGARLHFYESGTTRPADTFADVALSVPNTNPVVADSAGRFGDIFLRASDYKVVLTDAAGAVVWTADPLSGRINATGDDFVPSEQSPRDMTLLVGPGKIFNAVSGRLVERTAQTTPLIAAPTNHPRRDIVHVDRLTGDVGVQTGIEAANPEDPALPQGVAPVARVTTRPATTEITLADIDDVRVLNLVGAGSLASGNRSDIQAQHYTFGVDAGIANEFTAAYAPPPETLTDGMRLVFRAANPNTGPSTFTPNPGVVPSRPLRRLGGDLVGGEIGAGRHVTVEYDAASDCWELVSPWTQVPDMQTFTTSGTWIKPAGISWVLVRLWGGGGGGGRQFNSSSGGGGGGGEYGEQRFVASELPTNVSVIVGTGGSGRSSNGQGGDGGDSVFGSLLRAKGGKGGSFGSNAGGGAGGGVKNYGAGQAVPSSTGGDGNFEGGAGGAGGGARNGGNSRLGGAGGGGSSLGANSAHGLGGVSQFGGDGGEGGWGGTSAGDGAVPGGGGGGAADTISGSGADGTVIVFSW